MAKTDCNKSSLRKSYTEVTTSVLIRPKTQQIQTLTSLTRLVQTRDARQTFSLMKNM